MNFTITKRKVSTTNGLKDGAAHSLVPWDTLLNTRGTTWRKLSDDERSNVDEEKACELMKTYPSLVKRPVLVDYTGQVYVGFSEAQYQGIKF